MGSIMSCYSYALSMIESVSLWLMCTVLVCCIVTTITLVLGLGIGLGYNYCFVDMVTRYKYVPARYLYPDNSHWSYQEEQDRTNSQETLQNVPHVLRIKEDAEMFKKVFDSERQHDQDTQKYQFHYTLEKISPKSTISNIEDITNLKPIGKSLVTNTIGTDDNNMDVTKKIFSYQFHSTPEVKIILESTISNIEDITRLTPTRTSLVINITGSDDNNMEVTKKIFSESTTNGSKVKDIDLKKPIPISPSSLLTLLAKLRAENKNYTLQIVTT